MAEETPKSSEKLENKTTDGGAAGVEDPKDANSTTPIDDSKNTSTPENNTKSASNNGFNESSALNISDSALNNSKKVVI